MGLERDWRQEEMLRGKVPKWNSREDESREDFPPKIRELLHQGYMLVLRSAASRARSAGNMEELARLCPPKSSGSTSDANKRSRASDSTAASAMDDLAKCRSVPFVITS